MDQVANFFGEISSVVWGPFVLIPLLALTGVILTVRLRGLQFAKLIPALRLGLLDRKDEGADDGDISQF